MAVCAESTAATDQHHGYPWHMSDGPVFTVFTATFDRAHTLPRVYRSLQEQTFRSFEWLIVDDASTDGTAELVRGWQQDAAFPIRYVRQEHGGKHAAFNRGVSLATGDLFLSIDSDDACVPEALERFWHHWVSIDPAAQPPFSAVTALAADQDGRVIGEPFAMSPTDSTSLEMYFGRGPRGDNWGFHATNVLRQFPFPEPPGVTFVAESIVWFAISRRYRTRYVNDVLLTVHSDAQGTRLSSLSPGTARGRLMFHQAVIEDYLDFLFRSPNLVLRSFVNYARYSYYLRVGSVEQIRRVRRWPTRMLLAPLLPVGRLLARRDRRPSTD